MVRSALKWHGGKGYLAKRIAGSMPPHETYVEPFAGGLSTLLAKPEAPIEIAGDLNSQLIDFWTTLRDRPGEMIERVGTIPYTEEAFHQALEALEASNPVERAAAFLVRNRFSRGGLAKDFAWSERTRGGQPGDVNAWQTFKRLLPGIAARVQGVQFVCANALELIERYDSPATLIYADPPYLPQTRTVRKAYRHEMSRPDHERLLATLTRASSMTIISGYASPLYDSALAGWERDETELPNNAGQTKRKSRRVEVLWFNPACNRFALRT